MTHLIKVTNKNDFVIKDYFDGIRYLFAPDKPINVPLDAMRHIFGMDFPADEAMLKSLDFREALFMSVSRRWGWNSHDPEIARKHRHTLSNIAFTPIMMQQVEVVANNPEITAPREQKSAPKAAKFKPRADESEEPSEEEVA